MCEFSLGIGGIWGSRGLSGTSVGGNIGGGDWLFLRDRRPPRDMAVADRTFRTAGLLDGGRPASRIRSLGEAPLASGVGLCAPSLPPTGTFLELDRVGTGNGGAAAAELLMVLGRLGLLDLCM